MKVLVAGGTGVLGSRVAPLLVRAGHEVTATTRSPSKIAGIDVTGATGVVLDALDPASVDDVVSRVRPDAIVHLLTDLANVDLAGNARLRGLGTRHLVASARQHGVTRMIAESISWVYEPGKGLASEETPFAQTESGEPAFPSIEVLESEVLSLTHGTVLRFGILYGSGTWYGRDGAMFDAASRGTVTATTRYTSFVHVDDAAGATVSALSWPRGIVNIVDDDPADVAEWGPVLVRAAGGPLAEITARSDGRAASNGRAQDLGWVPQHPSWREGPFDLN